MTVRPRMERAMLNIRNIIAHQEPFMNVHSSWWLCWLMVAAMKTYYLGTRLTNMAIPRNFVLLQFSIAIFTYLYVTGCTPLTAFLIGATLLAILYQIRQRSRPGWKWLPYILVVACNFFSPLRFISDVVLVQTVTREFLEESLKLRDMSRVAIILFLMPLYLTCCCYGEPGAGSDFNRIPIFVGWIILGLMGYIGNDFESPLREKVFTVCAVLYVPMSHLV